MCPQRLHIGESPIILERCPERAPLVAFEADVSAVSEVEEAPIVTSVASAGAGA